MLVVSLDHSPDPIDRVNGRKQVKKVEEGERKGNGNGGSQYRDVPPLDVQFNKLYSFSIHTSFHLLGQTMPQFFFSN